MTYLILKDAKSFTAFTEKAFGAKQTLIEMRDENTIMHAEIMIDECTIMYADATDEFSVQNATFFLYVNNADQSFQKALNAGASKIRDPEDQPYGRSGGVRDPFGNSWWVVNIP
jgi:uncharacterized glyoxalase superfamily protein PhnB